MEYTEQQKKEYQEMRRQRYKDQQELRTYLKGGFEMSAEEKKSLRHSGHTKVGRVFQKNMTQSKWTPVQKQGYKVILNK